MDNWVEPEATGGAERVSTAKKKGGKGGKGSDKGGDRTLTKDEESKIKAEEDLAKRKEIQRKIGVRKRQVQQVRDVSSISGIIYRGFLCMVGGWLDTEWFI